MAKKKSSKKAVKKSTKKASKKSSRGGAGAMSKSRASKVLRSGRGGKGAKSAAALALSGQKSKAERRASGKVAKYERNLDKPWTSANDQELRDLIDGNTPTRVIGLKLGRSEASIYDRAAALGVSLKPANRSPYNRSS